ncbi:hypothetical protein CYMTET_54146 [Cymbomonas tetramitiformis]|uniref:Uncharacterized protein n=1 Tax=Cymbomonas tetramitiformis TaxID=36881 RepID=A0AAE0BGQ6_9CHLO|nr:hypothetical protein CYMTET_54146 [Cymbomonas tetramitiformis]
MSAFVYLLTCFLLKSAFLCTFHASTVQSAGDEKRARDLLQGLSCEGGPCSLGAGEAHTCVLLHGATSGVVRCWGNDEYGQLGRGNATSMSLQDQDLSVPEEAIEFGGSVWKLSVGAFHNCALRTNGSVGCWGSGANGRLGNGNILSVGYALGSMPPGAVHLNDSAIAISAGEDHTCAVLQNGTVHCWGGNAFGQLGYGHSRSIGDEAGEMPPPAVDLGVYKAMQVTAGSLHTCVLTEPHRLVLCWGDSRFGQAGPIDHVGFSTFIGDEAAEMPPRPLQIGALAEQVSAGCGHTCVILSQSYDLVCFGHNRRTLEEAKGARVLGARWRTPRG